MNPEWQWSKEELFIQKIKGNEGKIRNELTSWIIAQKPESKVKEKVRKSIFAPDIDVLELTKGKKLIAYEVKTVSVSVVKSLAMVKEQGKVKHFEHTPTPEVIYTGLGEVLLNLLQFTDEVYLVYPDVDGYSKKLESLNIWFPLPFGLIKFFSENKRFDFKVVLSSPYNPALGIFKKDEIPEDIKEIREQLIKLF